MSARSIPTVFISHSHRDKRVARRLVRRLTAHGIKVWIDERELQVGTSLTSTIRTQIQNVDILLVIASKASARSKWVGLEVDFAQERDIKIIPFYIDPLAKHRRFRDYLGVDATVPQEFADVVYKLIHDIFRSFDLNLPPAAPDILTAGLQELMIEEPDLAPLIVSCLESKSLHQENTGTVYNVAFHPLDDALNTLFELKPNGSIANYAACGFCSAGVGAKALSSWIGITGEGKEQLVTAIGSKSLAPAMIPTAIKLLAACNPPNDRALYNFIHYNVAQLDETHCRSVVRLVTWPVRATPAGWTDVLGYVALKHFPDTVEIQNMWIRWIRAGAFDGEPKSPDNLAFHLATADKNGLPGWWQVNKALQGHVRECLRSGNEEKVNVAFNHIIEAANNGGSVLSSLLHEAKGISATYEWKKWAERDPDIAEQMEAALFYIAEEATGDRDWSRASERAKKSVEFRRQERLELQAGKLELNADE